MKSPLLEINLERYFEEAARSLGLIRPEAATWLAQHAHTIDGLSRGPEAIRREWGDQWRTALTDLGEANPVESFDQSYFFAINKARWEQRRAKEARMVECGTFAVLTVAPVPTEYCSVGKRLSGEILTRHPELPRVGCEKKVCRCSWRLVTRREAEALLQDGKARKHQNSSEGNE